MAGTERESRRREERWLKTTVEITRVLAQEVQLQKVLDLTARRLHEASGADCVHIGITTPGHAGGVAYLQAVEGPGIEHLNGRMTTVQGLAERVTDSGEGIVSPRITTEPDFDPPPELVPAMSDIGLGMYLPLSVAGNVFGALVAGWRRGSPHANLAAREVQLIEMVTGQAALAIEQARSHSVISEDRARIAEELRDDALARILAVGTRLRDVSRLAAQPEIHRRLGDVIRQLDEATRRTHATISSLVHSESPSGPLVIDELLKEVGAARSAVGTTPKVAVHGALDCNLAPDSRRELVLAVRRCLAEAATRDDPSAVEITVVLGADQPALIVGDGPDVRRATRGSSALTRTDRCVSVPRRL